jgi:hypothetical protein
MKRLFLSAIAIVILTACSSNTDQANLNIGKKPSLPKKPTIQQNLQANILGTMRDNEENTANSNSDIGGLIDRINKNLEQKNITDEDIKRGWYYGSEDEKKWGTPENWLWVNKSAESHWISPNALEQESDIEMDSLCRKTGGYYVISCVERDLPHCEHISKSECRCSHVTKWMDDSQGCISVNDKDEFIKITKEELNRGWYYGSQNGKKLNTPASWIWAKNGQESKWQNPGTLD